MQPLHLSLVDPVNHLVCRHGNHPSPPPALLCWDGAEYERWPEGSCEPLQRNDRLNYTGNKCCLIISAAAGEKRDSGGFIDLLDEGNTCVVKQTYNSQFKDLDTCKVEELLYVWNRYIDTSCKPIRSDLSVTQTTDINLH